jgi:hypothetical protein
MCQFMFDILDFFYTDSLSYANSIQLVKKKSNSIYSSMQVTSNNLEFINYKRYFCDKKIMTSIYSNW